MQYRSTHPSEFAVLLYCIQASAVGYDYQKHMDMNPTMRINLYYIYNTFEYKKHTLAFHYPSTSWLFLHLNMEADQLDPLTLHQQPRKQLDTVNVQILSRQNFYQIRYLLSVVKIWSHFVLYKGSLAWRNFYRLKIWHNIVHNFIIQISIYLQSKWSIISFRWNISILVR